MKEGTVRWTSGQGKVDLIDKGRKGEMKGVRAEEIKTILFTHHSRLPILRGDNETLPDFFHNEVKPFWVRRVTLDKCSKACASLWRQRPGDESRRAWSSKLITRHGRPT